MTQKFSLPVEPVAHYWRYRVVELGRVTSGTTAVIYDHWPYVGDDKFVIPIIPPQSCLS